MFHNTLMTKAGRLFLFLLFIFIGCSGISTGGDGNDDTDDGSDNGSDSDDATDEVATVINEYRLEQGLDEIPLSSSLKAVAEAHVQDLEENNPDTGDCNTHSWSDEGDWTACCYTSDHAEAECMWDKPDEITDGVYTSEGYEIAVFTTSIMTADAALESWQSSDPHLDVILNRDVWESVEWKALGAAISEHYAVTWFGTEEDPAP